MWVFEITNNLTSVTTTIDNPIGWDKAVFEVSRHKEYHGIFFDYSFDSLQFVNGAANILEDAYLANGVEADCELTVTWDCDVEQVVYQGKFNFHKYKKTCSYDAGCWIEMPVENSGHLMKMWNRFDQSVDLDSLTAFDGSTVMDAYGNLGVSKSIPAKGIQKTVKTELVATNTIDITTTDLAFSDFANSAITSIQGHSSVPFDNIALNEFSYIYGDPVQYFVENANFGSGGPQVVQNFENLETSLAGNSFNVTLNLAGEVEFVIPGGILDIVNFGADCFIRIVKVAGDPDVTPATTLATQLLVANGSTLLAGTHSFPFLFFYSGTHTLAYNEKIYVYLNYNLARNNTGSVYEINQTFSDNNYLKVDTIELSNPTTAPFYFINESLSRATESITDGAMLVYSDYFGRTDAEPYTSASDGCGGLEAITKGLLLRGVPIAGTNTPLMSVSLKSLIDNLNKIHCIGIGVEPDAARPGFDLLRVEQFEYFYSDTILMNCIAVNKLEIETKIEGFISVLKIGYKKYEGEEYNGIDEFLSSREYRSTMSCNKKELDLTCEFIASGYAIEVTRNKFTDTKDWRFDNDIFILCFKRDSGIVVEQGNLNTTDNVIDPNSILNYRLSPFRNLLRWAKVILSQYIPTSTEAKFIFTDGTGNYFAEGILEDGCILEQDSTANSEQAEISEDSFELAADAVPLWMPERINFEYPLTVAEYNIIKATPYGKIGYSFANEPISYGWVDTIKYKADEGIAEFTLIPER